MLYVIGYGELDKVPDDAIIINTTSRSKTWSKGLSPFFLGPCEMYNGLIAKNVECGYQFSKIYTEHVDLNGNIKPEYYEWRNNGYNLDKAVRYPMGKGRKPLYSFWDGKKLDYIDNRKQIYLPLYSKAVVKSDAFKQLKELYLTTDKDIYLQDFDGYLFPTKNCNSFKQVINNPNKKCGHAFIIWLLLQRIKPNRTTDNLF